MRPAHGHIVGKLFYTVGGHMFSWDRKTRTWVSSGTQTSYASVANMQKYSESHVMRFAAALAANPFKSF